MVNTGRTSKAQATRLPISAGTSGAPDLNALTQSANAAPVSVVVPCFRCAHTIAQAVASVAAQIMRPAEVLLVEDGSGDGTLEQLHRVAAAYPPGWVKVIALPRNSGPWGAPSGGGERASQPWIAFLDADDSWHPQKLKLQMAALTKDPQIALIAHDMNVQPRSALAPALKYPLQLRVFAPRLTMLRSPFPTASIMLRRDLPFRFDEARWRAEDFMLWAQILLSGHRCAKLNQVLASWHKPPFGAGGLSGDMAAMYEAAGDVRKALHEQGLLTWWQWRLGQAMSLARYLRRRMITFKRRHEGLFLARRNA